MPRSAGLGLVAVALVAVVAACSAGTGMATRSPDVTAPPSPAATVAPPVITVGEFLAARAAGTLSSPVFLRGFWTDRSFGHSCTAPDSPAGVLEIRCHDGEFGITERNEPIGTLSESGAWTPATGPAVTPYVDDVIAAPLFTLPISNGQRHPPVPIVVEGHVDDPRAADCRPVAVAVCRDRLVIDRIVSFDPAAVPTPGITAPPTPFPFDDPPPAAFGTDRCHGDVPYAFVGWTRLGDVAPSVGVDPDEVVFAMVTRDPVDLGNGRRGRSVCYAREDDPGTVILRSPP